MIDFKNKDELTTNVVICASLAAFVIAAGSMVLLPKPAGPNPKGQRIAENRIKGITKKMTQEIGDVKQQLSSETWPGNPEDVGPVALKEVNTLLQNRHLKLGGFHSDKAFEEPNITLIPFILSVDGSFSNVMAFTRDLEKPETKLVVTLFQVSNADQSDDKVTASIGVTAYQLPVTTKSDTAASTPSNSTKSSTDGKTPPATKVVPTAKPRKEVKKDA